MLKDITIGQYLPGHSFLHSLDPRTKIIAVLIYMISLFVVNNFFGLGFMLLLSFDIANSCEILFSRYKSNHLYRESNCNFTDVYDTW